MTAPVCTIDPVRPRADLIRAAADAVVAGGVVVFPTSTLYGLGADAFNRAAVERVFKIKRRASDKPLLVLISHLCMLPRVVAAVPPLAAELMDRFWPGGLTLVLQGRKDLPRGLCSHTGKVGVRMVGHPVAAALVNAVGGPITGTSANLSGAGGCVEVSDVDPKVLSAVQMALDAGALGGGPGSTVVDATGPAPLMLRQGTVAATAIMKGF